MNKYKYWRTVFLSVVLSGIFCMVNVPLSVFAKPKDSRPKIAIIPFQNFSGQFGAGEQIMTGLTEVLHKDFFLTPKAHVERILTDLRVRHMGCLTSKEIKKIGRKLKVEALLLGLVETYRQEPFPQMSFFCKLILTTDDAPLLWAKNFCARGNQTVYLLQRKGDTEWSSLMRSTAEDLLRSLPKNIRDTASYKSTKTKKTQRAQRDDKI